MVYYGFAVFRTSICKIPIHVALYIEVQLLLLQVLTRRMQLGLKHSMAEIEEGGVPAKGKGKGRGGKGRGRGRGRAKSSNPAPEVPETENVEVGEPSFKKRTKATTPATTPAPDPKAKAKSKSRSKRSQKKEPGAEVVENQDASGSRDGLPAALSHDAVPTAASSDAAPAVPKRRRLRRVVDAEVAPLPIPKLCLRSMLKFHMDLFPMLIMLNLPIVLLKFLPGLCLMLMLKLVACPWVRMLLTQRSWLSMGWMVSLSPRSGLGAVCHRGGSPCPTSVLASFLSPVLRTSQS